jgi:hypothetical protein
MMWDPRDLQLELMAMRICAAAYSDLRRAGHDAREATLLAIDAKRDFWAIWWEK